MQTSTSETRLEGVDVDDRENKGDEGDEGVVGKVGGGEDAVKVETVMMAEAAMRGKGRDGGSEVTAVITAKLRMSRTNLTSRLFRVPLRLQWSSDPSRRERGR